MLIFISVNWWAVIIATAAAMAIGFAWYSPMLFAKPWLAMTPGANRRTKAQVNERMLPAILVSLLSNLVMAYVLAVLMRYVGSHTAVTGIVTALWIAVGFIFTMSLQNAMYSWKPLKLLAIDEGYVFVSLIVMGAIIGAM